uniref:COesterase domain-containing protein n=1 Tax=Macrostomum lignano TaxID=282301 RepID=A0A1I8GJK9_9PLAT
AEILAAFARARGRGADPETSHTTQTGHGIDPHYLLLLLALSAAAVSAQRNFTIVRYLNVTTTQGPIRGAVHIGSFLGINFAKVPTGEFRFAHPVFTKWDFVQDALDFDRRCYQDPGASGDYQTMSESCIAANIWTPYNGTSSNPGSYPVLVWIHGGRFETGSIIEEINSGRVLTAHESIVTVSLQYRLGVLGFLRLSSTVAPGNMGLKDQALGLEFVHKNIERFGGNLQTVTLMGLDAGAAAVGYHMLNDNTKTYFKRAVMLGGSPMVFWSVRNDTSLVERLHLDFAVRQLSCPLPDQGDFNATIQCLREVSPEKLVNEQLNYNRLFQGVEFPPVIDGDYIKEDPIEAFRNGRFEGMSLMIGVTNAEAAVYVERSLESQKLTQDQLADRATYERVLRTSSALLDRDVMYDRLTDFGNPSGPAQYKRWLDGASDRLFVSAANEFAEKMFEKNQGTSNDVYFYVFSEQDNTPNYIGASHGSDAYYFFGNPTDDAPIVKPEQAQLSVG